MQVATSIFLVDKKFFASEPAEQNRRFFRQYTTLIIVTVMSHKWSLW